MLNRIQGSTTKRVVRKTATSSPPAKRESVPTSSLARCAEAWIMDCKSAQVSPRYIEQIEFVTGRLLWWLQREQLTTCDADAIRGWILYVQTAHERPEGRWGELGQSRADHEATRARGYKPTSIRYKAVSPRTVLNYWRTLRAFFSWLKDQGQLDISPMTKLKQPLARADQLRPFTEEEVKALIAAAGKGKYPRRDRALVLFCLDTGVRVSELCGLVWRDIDTLRRAASVVGKGSKKREIYWSRETGRALWQWAQEQERAADPEAPVFSSIGGNTPGSPLTRGGVLKIVRQLGEAAGIESARCSPHTLRHTFAVMFLRAGGSQFALMDALGHTNLEMSRKYVQFTGADRAQQSRQFSPVASLEKK